MIKYVEIDVQGYKYLVPDGDNLDAWKYQIVEWWNCGADYEQIKETIIRISIKENRQNTLKILLDDNNS